MIESTSIKIVVRLCEVSCTTFFFFLYGVRERDRDAKKILRGLYFGLRTAVVPVGVFAIIFCVTIGFVFDSSGEGPCLRNSAIYAMRLASK